MHPNDGLRVNKYLAWSYVYFLIVSLSLTTEYHACLNHKSFETNVRQLGRKPSFSYPSRVNNNFKSIDVL